MWNRLRRWLNDLPIPNPIERRQALLVQVILLGLSGVLLCSALLTLVAFPFTSGAIAAANLHNSINNFRLILFFVAPFVLLRRGYFRVAVAILMIELFLLAFNTIYAQGLETGWIGALVFALPISLAALALGRRWLLVIYAASIAGVAATAFARYPLTGLPQNAPSAIIAFALIAGLLALFLDRFGTAFRESLAALAHNYSLLSAVIEGTPDAVYVKDLHGCYLMINSAGAHMLGLAAEKMIGKDDTVLFGADTAGRMREDERRIMERGDMQPYEHSAIANGVTRSYLATKGPYRDQQSNVIGVISISRDITEHKNLEAQLCSHRRWRALASSPAGSPMTLITCCRPSSALSAAPARSYPKIARPSTIWKSRKAPLGAQPVSRASC